MLSTEISIDAFQPAVTKPAEIPLNMRPQVQPKPDNAAVTLTAVLPEGKDIAGEVKPVEGSVKPQILPGDQQNKPLQRPKPSDSSDSSTTIVPPNEKLQVQPKPVTPAEQTKPLRRPQRSALPNRTTEA